MELVSRKNYPFSLWNTKICFDVRENNSLNLCLLKYRRLEFLMNCMPWFYHFIKISFISEEACWYQSLNLSSKEVPRIWSTQQRVQQTLVTFYVLALMLMAQVVIPVHFRLYSKVQFQSWPISNVAIQLPPPFTKQQTNHKLTFISKNFWPF